jgi:hypothetical protein
LLFGFGSQFPFFYGKKIFLKEEYEIGRWKERVRGRLRIKVRKERRRIRERE